VYPAVTVLQSLGTDADPVLWVGSQGGLETGLVQRAGIPYQAIPAGGVHLSGRDLLRLPANLLRLGRGYLAARKILRNFKPDLLLFTGGFVAVPMALAGSRYPSLVYVPDIEPALALKAIIRKANCVAVTNTASSQYLPAQVKTTVTGYPVRTELLGWDRPTARKHFGLQDGLPVLLVSGGSRGARPINTAITQNIQKLLEFCQIIHITGELDWDEVQRVRQHLTAEENTRYHLFPYLHEDMGAAFACADLAVSRAGASVLGEYPAFGLPAILSPYPHAWRYQKINAAYLESQGAALTIVDADLTTRLLEVVSSLFQDSGRLNAMKSAMQSLSRPDAARVIADLARNLVSGRRSDGGRS
jgi:UDP-N-acetylglucosamine--N-acetylmuramyl-(pentapeptide) pyrophosphoryl-undecaprenol N-acetylglucosamine transferase